MRLPHHLASSDLILAVGGHFGDVETQGYSILQPREGQEVIHVAHSEQDIDRYLPATFALEATPLPFFDAMLAAGNNHADRRTRLETMHTEEVQRSTPRVGSGDPFADIMGWLQEELPEDAIIANGAGNYAVWVHRYLRYRTYGTQMAPASGAMGFGLPAGIGASRVTPHRPVIIFGGDGCFTMAVADLSTLIGSNANITIIVVNNGTYGTIRLHQEKTYPGRVSGTNIANPDFVKLAEAYGLNAARVQTVEDFAAAYVKFRDIGGPRLIEITLDTDRSTPDVLLSAL